MCSSRAFSHKSSQFNCIRKTYELFTLNEIETLLLKTQEVFKSHMADDLSKQVMLTIVNTLTETASWDKMTKYLARVIDMNIGK